MIIVSEYIANIQDSQIPYGVRMVLKLKLKAAANALLQRYIANLHGSSEPLDLGRALAPWCQDGA